MVLSLKQNCPHHEAMWAVAESHAQLGGTGCGNPPGCEVGYCAPPLTDSISSAFNSRTFSVIVFPLLADKPIARILALFFALNAQFPLSSIHS
jgi:hypothetical protein